MTEPRPYCASSIARALPLSSARTVTRCVSPLGKATGDEPVDADPVFATPSGKRLGSVKKSLR